jgi:predicted hotdog family 3-hydroxylacyl-ACP dehydratase
MLLVERIVDVFDDGIVCAGRVPADGPLARGGTASAFLAVELAAQAAAALEALRRAPGGGEPRIGYLASIRDARFAVPELPAGSPLLATVRSVGSVPPLAMYSAVVTLAEHGDELLTATLSTYLVG